MAKIKIMKEGKLEDFELPGEPAYKEMGILPTSEVDALAARKLDEGKRAREAEIAEIKKELEAAKAAQGDSGKAKDRLGQLEATVKTLTEKLEAEQKAKDSATWQAQTAQAFSGVVLVEGALDYFRSYAAQKRDGEGYILANGSKGNLEALKTEWANSEAGKRLVITTQKGGAGTQGGGITGKSIKEIFADPSMKAKHLSDLVATHGEKAGRQKFAADALAAKK